MGRKRLVLAAVGSIAVVLGVVTALAPSLSGALGLPNVPAIAVGGLAGFFGMLVALRRRNSRLYGAEPPDVEETADQPTPGAAFDAQLRGATGIGVQAARYRRTSREHLLDVATTVLTMTEGYTEEEARAALSTGSWTDDPIAAAAFADEPPRLGLRASVAQYLDRRSTYERELVHVIDALQDCLLEGRRS